jgi:hypothetical protein
VSPAQVPVNGGQKALRWMERSEPRHGWPCQRGESSLRPGWPRYFKYDQESARNRRHKRRLHQLLHPDNATNESYSPSSEGAHDSLVALSALDILPLPFRTADATPPGCEENNSFYLNRRRLQSGAPRLIHRCPPIFSKCHTILITRSATLPARVAIRSKRPRLHGRQGLAIPGCFRFQPSQRGACRR